MLAFNWYLEIGKSTSEQNLDPLNGTPNCPPTTVIIVKVFLWRFDVIPLKPHSHRFLWKEDLGTYKNLSKNQFAQKLRASLASLLLPCNIIYECGRSIRVFKNVAVCCPFLSIVDGFRAFWPENRCVFRVFPCPNKRNFNGGMPSIWPSDSLSRFLLSSSSVNMTFSQCGL